MIFTEGILGLLLYRHPIQQLKCDKLLGEYGEMTQKLKEYKN